MSKVPRAYAKASRSYKPAQTSEPGFTLNKLNPDDFHEICGLSETVRNIVPDAPYFDCPFRVGAVVITPEGRGELTGFAIDSETNEVSPYARVGGRLYHVKVLQRA
jgi:hypothetical protein